MHLDTASHTFMEDTHMDHTVQNIGMDISVHQQHVKTQAEEEASDQVCHMEQAVHHQNEQQEDKEEKCNVPDQVERTEENEVAEKLDGADHV